MKEPMEVEEKENYLSCGMLLMKRSSTQSIEDDNISTIPSPLGLQNFESFFEQPKLFRGFSDIRENEKDAFLELFGEEQPFRKIIKVDDESLWNGVEAEEFDVFSLPFGQREDMLGESRQFGSA